MRMRRRKMMSRGLKRMSLCKKKKKSIRKEARVSLRRKASRSLLQMKRLPP